MASWFFSRPRESFLVLRVLPARAEGLLLNLENGKRFVPKKFWRQTDLTNLVRESVSPRLNSNIVVSAHPSLVCTAVLPADLIRENPKEPISAVEMENLLSQVAGKIFNQCRVDAAKKLQVDDLDVILVGSRVLDFRLDNHRVLNPVGFEARHVRADLELTLTARALFQEVKPALQFLKRRSGKKFFFTESVRAELKALEKVSEPPLGLLVLSANGSHYAALGDGVLRGTVLPRKEVKWQTGLLVQAISEEWAVGRGVAERVYSLYLENGLSPRASRALKRTLAPVIQELFKEIASLRVRGKVFVDSDVPLPVSLPLRKKGLFLKEIPVGEITSKLGFETGSNVSWRLLAPVLEFYGDKSDSEINRWLRRHLHWLGSPI